MAVKDAYNIIIVPADHSGTRQYTVTRRLLWTAGVLLALLLITVSVFLATYGQVLAKSRRVDRLEIENLRLRTQVATIEDLGKELERMSAIKAQVLMMLGVEVEGELVAETLEDDAAQGQLAALELLGLDHMKAAESLQSFAPSRWPVEGYISKEFYLEEESTDAHPGLDLVAPLEAPILAAGRGRVREARYDEYLGNYIVIDHGFGYSSLYGHNARLLVDEGQSVDQGQVIAHLGNTGKSSAPHLHFEIRVDNEAVDPKLHLGPQ